MRNIDIFWNYSSQFRYQRTICPPQTHCPLLCVPTDPGLCLENRVIYPTCSAPRNRHCADKQEFRQYRRNHGLKTLGKQKASVLNPTVTCGFFLFYAFSLSTAKKSIPPAFQQRAPLISVVRFFYHKILWLIHRPLAQSVWYSEHEGNEANFSTVFCHQLRSF